MKAKENTLAIAGGIALLVGILMFGYFMEGSRDAGRTRVVPQATVQLRYDPKGPDRDCGDFANWTEANAFFKAAGPGDPHRLDADGDEFPCERLYYQ